MSTLKNGRTPISPASRATRHITAEEAFGGGTFDIPDHIKEEFKQKGWVARWLNAKEVYKNQGYHKRGWQVYRQKANSAPLDFKFGTDPDGVIRRGDCILGYKTKDQHDKHTAYLDQRRKTQSAYKSKHKKDLQAFAAENRIDTAIDDSTEED